VPWAAPWKHDWRWKWQSHQGVAADLASIHSFHFGLTKVLKIDEIIENCPKTSSPTINVAMTLLSQLNSAVHCYGRSVWLTIVRIIYYVTDTEAYDRSFSNPQRIRPSPLAVSFGTVCSNFNKSSTWVFWKNVASTFERSFGGLSTFPKRTKTLTDQSINCDYT